MTTGPLNAGNPPPTGEAVDARPERRVAVNSGLLLVAFSFQAAVSLVIVSIVARYLGQTGLGRYA
jgi:O-antigen/teichoic acid export membrane protein